MKKERQRDRGRYADEFERMCTCGHTKGVHVAGGHECIVGELEDVPNCSCRKYRRAPKQNPARMIANPHWEPLTENGKPRPELRDAMRGRAGVYLLRKRGAKRVTYVGSSVPGEKQRQKKPAELRLWKTILRHFQACKTRGGKYSFGEDNFCDPGGAHDYELAVMLTTASEARELETRAIDKFQPLHMPRDFEEVPF